MESEEENPKIVKTILHVGTQSIDFQPETKVRLTFGRIYRINPFVFYSNIAFSV